MKSLLLAAALLSLGATTAQAADNYTLGADSTNRAPGVLKGRVETFEFNESAFKAAGLEKPADRRNAENKEANRSRYEIDPALSIGCRWALGAHVFYTENGAHIHRIYPGLAADSAGLRVGDIIMEVDGKPTGTLRSRIYPVWKYYEMHENGKVELLIAHRAGKGFRYFYPNIQLTEAGPIQQKFPEIKSPNEGI
jgi:hypothetical protein